MVMFQAFHGMSRGSARGVTKYFVSIGSKEDRRKHMQKKAD